jgi:hypothetical protein
MRDWASVSAKGLATDKTRETWFEGPILAIRTAPPCIILHKVTHRKYMSSHYTRMIGAGTGRPYANRCPQIRENLLNIALRNTPR